MNAQLEMLPPSKEARKIERRPVGYTKSVREIGLRYEAPHYADPILQAYAGGAIKSPEEAGKILRAIINDDVRERFIVLCLDAQNKLIAYRELTAGTLNASLVHPREVYHVAIRTLSASIIVGHNHPSGNTEPSREDTEITRQLAEAGKVIGIPMHDHVIIAGSGHTSLAERGIF